jgi:hypothetical protein
VAENGEGESLPPPPLLHPLMRIQAWRECPPLTPLPPPGLMAPVLSTQLASCLTTSLGKVTPTGCCKHIRDPMQEHAYIEKQILAQFIKNESQQTHPGAVDPFP